MVDAHVSLFIKSKIHTNEKNTLYSRIKTNQKEHTTSSLANLGWLGIMHVKKDMFIMYGWHGPVIKCNH